MSALARWCFNHRWVVVLAWIAVLVGLVAVERSVGTAYSTAFTLPGTESFTALERLKAAMPKQAGDSATIVWHVDSGTINDAAAKARIQAMLAKVATSPSVALVTDPYTVGAKTQAAIDAAADGLHQSRGDELVQALGQPGQERSDREDPQCGQEEPPSAPDVGQAARQRHGHDIDQQVAVDDPGCLAQIRPVGQGGQDLRQSDGRDHQLEAGQEDTDSEYRQEHVRVASSHVRSVRA